MKVEFSSQPDNAKVWVYQADRILSDQDKAQLLEIGNFFLDQWESHNLPVHGSLEVKYDRFIVISAFSNEDAMCGRAKDAQMRLMKELEEVLQCSFTDRMLVFYEQNNEVESFHFSELSRLLEDNKISAETTIFNGMVDTKSAFESGWKAPLKDTWLNRFL